MNPFTERTIGATQPGNISFDVPYITQINPTLYWGGCSTGLFLPKQIKHVIQLYQHESYTITHKIDSHLRYEFHDSETQDLSAVEILADWVNFCQKTGPVLVHCMAGMNRSGLVVARSLIKLINNSAQTTPLAVINRLREMRSPAALSNQHFYNYLTKGN